MKISVVIIARDEAENIEACIQSALQLTDDIILVDTGSNDDTIQIAKSNGAKVFRHIWSGYGQARNIGARFASYNWILSLDADERLTKSLISDIVHLNPDPSTIYGFRRDNYFGKKLIQAGSLAREKVYRFYHRRITEWDDAEVHEKIISTGLNKELLFSHIEHYGINDREKYVSKRMHYAELCALKYFRSGKKAAFVLQYLSPFFSFIKCFILNLGFVSGRQGLFIAMTNARYTLAKYKLLFQRKRNNKLEGRHESMVIRMKTAKAFEA